MALDRNITLKSKYINSKKLFNSIDKTVRDVIDIFSLQSPINKDVVIDIMEEYLDDFIIDGRVTQYAVHCTDIIDSAMILTIKYKQAHCLNTTELVYVVSELENDTVTAEDILNQFLYGGIVP